MTRASESVGPYSRSAVLLTCGLWLFAVVLFGVAGGIMDGRWSPWMPAWLAGLSLSGMAFSALLMWIAVRSNGRRRLLGWALLACAVVTAAFLQAVADFLILGWAHALAGERFRGQATFSIGFNLLVYLWLFGLFVTALKLQHSAALAHRQERQLLEARAAADRARLDALRHQVNPHFLFNTLNGVQTLIAAGRQDEAGAMVQRLSEYMRVSLDAEQGDMARLDAELEAVEAYLEVERARFGDRLMIEIECAPAIGNLLVPSLILQPLVENAMTHAVARSTVPVLVGIACRLEDDELTITVRDTGEETSAGGGLGLGLSNVLARLKLLFGDRAAVRTARTSKGFQVEIRQPAIAEPPSDGAVTG